MTVYCIFPLKKGLTWNPDPSPEVNELQKAHPANLKRLADMDKLVVNGLLLDSFASGGEMRGIGAIKTDSMEEARVLSGTDPMVKVGRLIFGLHAWMIDKNILP